MQLLVLVVSKHLANVFETGEQKEEATISKMETVQQEGNREVKRMVVMCKLGQSLRCKKNLESVICA